DERAQGSGQGKGRGEEKRERRVDVIISASEVVAHLVAPENRENRRAVPQAVQEETAARCWRKARIEVRIERRVVRSPGTRGRRDGHEQQDDVPPRPVLKLGTRLPRPLRGQHE